MRGLNFLYKSENTYEYDGNNYRVFKQTPTEKTYYRYDGSGNLRFERRGRTEIENFEPLFGVVVSQITERNNTQTTYLFIDKKSRKPRTDKNQLKNFVFGTCD